MGDIVKSIDKDQIKNIIYDNNHLNLWKNYPPNNCVIVETDHFTLVNSKISLAIQNGVTNFDTSKNISEKHIINAIDYFREKNLPFIWLLNDFQNPEQLIEVLIYYGLNFLGSQPGMALDLNSEYLILNPPSDLTFFKVENKEDLNIFANLTIKGFDLPQQKSYEFLQGYLLNNPLFNMYIGHYDHNPVCVGIVAFMNGVASLHNITTLPNHRKSGFGTAMTLKLIREAKKNNFAIVTLHSSEIAYKIYRGIGFMNYTKLHTFEYHVAS